MPAVRVQFQINNRVITSTKHIPSPSWDAGYYYTLERRQFLLSWPRVQAAARRLEMTVGPGYVKAWSDDELEKLWKELGW